MAKILDREATIKTVSVEIKALTVSGKRVTLALYRQIPIEPLINEDKKTLRGVPWGRVNVHDKECPSGYHLHVIWQRGDELYRTAIRDLAGYRHNPDYNELFASLESLDQLYVAG